MNRRRIAIVDYRIGNQTSVLRLLRSLGHRCVLTREPAELDQADLLVLPGVGAFPEAMAALHAYDLVEYLREQSRKRRPILGICLGMQLLADCSSELEQTPGLGLIPGMVSTLDAPRWHIGWNAVELTRPDDLFQPSDGECFYFNHSFGFEGPSEFVACVTRPGRPIVAAIRRDCVVGLQFHPEKSQFAGRRLLARLVDGLTTAD